MNQKRRFGLVRRYPIVGGRRLSNYWWSIVLFLGGCGFLLTGVSSYFNRNLLYPQEVTSATNVSSVSQGSSAAEHVTLSKQTMVSRNFSLASIPSEGRSASQRKQPLLRFLPTDTFECFGSFRCYLRYAKDPKHPKHRGMDDNSNPKDTVLSYTDPDLNAISRNFWPQLLRKDGNSYITSVGCDISSPYFGKDVEIRKKDKASPGAKQRIGGLKIVHPVLPILCFPPSDGTQWRDVMFAKPAMEGSIALHLVHPSIASHPKEGSTGWDILDVQQGIPSFPSDRGSNPASSNLLFFPQGLLLSFYGFFGLSFSFYLWFTLIWNIGAGFNEFNGKDRSVRIFRWGRPGKNRCIDFKYAEESIESIKIELVPKPALFLRVKEETGKFGDNFSSASFASTSWMNPSDRASTKNIPLTRIGDFIPLEDLETQAAELTSLLQIPLEVAD